MGDQGALSGQPQTLKPTGPAPAYSSLGEGVRASPSVQPYTTFTSYTDAPGAGDRKGLRVGGEKNPELEITVSDPVKQGEGVQAYVSYRVSTKTSLPQYRWSQFSVIRRFTDFKWMHARLVDKNHGVLVPPLPEKNAMEKYRFSVEFIEQRRQALDVFINRVACHPLLAHSTDLQLFLEASEEVWNIETTRSPEGSSLTGRPKELMKMFKGVQHTVTGAVMGKEVTSKRATDQEYEAIKVYVNTLESYCMEARRKTEGLLRRQYDLSRALAEFGVSAIMLGDVEGGVLSQPFTALGNRADALAAAVNKQTSELVLKFELPLKEYIRILGVIKLVLADRAHALLDQQMATEAVAAKKAKLARARAEVPVVPQRLTECEQEVSEATRREEVARDHYNLLAERMRGELARFQTEKTRDLSIIFRNLCVAEAKLAAEMAATWRSLIPEVEAIKVPAIQPAPAAR